MFNKINNSIISSLSLTLMKEYAYFNAADKALFVSAESFVKWQIQSMPDYLRMAFRILTTLFYLWVICTNFRSFSSMQYLNRKRIIENWRNSRIGVCRDFIRFYQTMVLFDYAAKITCQDD